MKIALYGVSRSGKDTLINSLIQKLNDKLVHLKGSKTLGELATEKYGKPLNETTEQQKCQLRKEFMKLVYDTELAHNSVIVDGHYAFPNNDNDFDVAFTDEDLIGYDVFVYLKRSPNTIAKHAKHDLLHPHLKWTTDESFTHKWMEYEIKSLKEICHQNHKNFIVLDDDATQCEHFLIDLVLNPENYLPSLISKRLVEKIAHLSINYQSILLLDCDKTISFDDPTMRIADELHVDRDFIKNIFKGDYYTIYQFYKLHKLIDSYKNKEIIQKTARETELNFNLIKDIFTKKSSVFTIGLTTGVGYLWEKINDKLSIFDLMIGYGSIAHEAQLSALITPEIKGEVAKQLVDLGKNVISVGDSIIDLSMLSNSSFSYVVANSKIDQRLQLYFDSNQNIKIKQLSYNQKKFNYIEEVESIWLEQSTKSQMRLED